MCAPLRLIVAVVALEPEDIVRVGVFVPQMQCQQLLLIRLVGAVRTDEPLQILRLNVFADHVPV